MREDSRALSGPMQEILQLEDEFTIAADTQRTISPPRVLKHGDTFAVFDQHGDVVAAEGGEHGLYHHGTRFLSTFEVLLAGRRPLLLSSTVSDDNIVFVGDLTNVDVRRDNRLVLPHGEVHIFRSRILGDGNSIDVIRLCNHSTQAIEMSLLVRFDADFADVFEVRGTRRVRRGSRLPDRGARTMSWDTSGSTTSNGGPAFTGAGHPTRLTPGARCSGSGSTRARCSKSRSR